MENREPHPPAWDDEDEDPSRPGTKPERLQSDEDPEDLVRRIMRAGKPQPGELDDEDDEE